jgi:hypothetical protein
MTDRWLQKSYLVTGLQPPLAYNVAMSLPANQPSVEPVAPTRRAANPRRGGTRLCRAALFVLALLGIGVLAAACGGGPSSPGVASAGKTTATTGSSATQGGSSTGLENDALAYVACMRTHGEPNMPEITINGNGVHMSASPGSGFDPNTPQYTAANKACEHLLPKKGGSSGANTITAADQADYLKAAACMRSHGVPNFPDPTFENNSVEFNAAGSNIDTSSPQYKSALATCQKLIPAGLPDSSTSGS